MHTTDICECCPMDQGVSNNRPSKLRQWTNEAMEAAMRAV